MLTLASCSRSEPPVYAGGMWLINKHNIEEMVTESPGYLLVHFSSYDKQCKYCISSNEKVIGIARGYAAKLKYARSTWEPWNRAPNDVIEDYDVDGIPMYVLYRDGRELWRKTGDTEHIYAQLVKTLDNCCGGKN